MERLQTFQRQHMPQRRHQPTPADPTTYRVRQEVVAGREIRTPGPLLPTSAPNPLMRPCSATVRSTGPAGAHGVLEPQTRPLRWPEAGGVRECAKTLWAMTR